MKKIWMGPDWIFIPDDATLKNDRSVKGVRRWIDATQNIEDMKIEIEKDSATIEIEVTARLTDVEVFTHCGDESEDDVLVSIFKDMSVERRERIIARVERRAPKRGEAVATVEWKTAGGGVDYHCEPMCERHHLCLVDRFSAPTPDVLSMSVSLPPEKGECLACQREVSKR